jgi:hypothetical protein
MEEQVSAVQIHWTKDYGQFRFLRGNRDLNEPKIKRIHKSVENGLEFFRYCPIMVNEDMYIIDGQHRFVVCKQRGLNIYYVIVPNFNLRQIAEINNNTSRWKDRDYLNCYMDVGIEDYKTLNEFCEMYLVNIKIASSLLMTGKVRGNNGDNSRDYFREGEFKVNYLEEAKHLLQKATQFHNFTETYCTRSFLQAIETLLKSETYDQVELLDKLRLHNLKIEHRSTAKEYLVHMEELFNFKNSKRKTIY